MFSLVKLYFYVLLSIHHGESRLQKGRNTFLNPLISPQQGRTRHFYMNDRLALIRKRQKYPYLLAFHSEGCPFTQAMDEIVEKVMEATSLYIHRYDVTKGESLQLLWKLDKETKCGGIPYYYNLRTHKHICGTTTFDNLLAWAMGGNSKSFLPLPIRNEDIEIAYRQTGFIARLVNKFRSVSYKCERHSNRYYQWESKKCLTD